MKRTLFLLISCLTLIRAEDIAPQEDTSNPPEMVEPITIPDPNENPDPVTAPGEVPGASLPENKEPEEPVDPLADFKRPDYITILYIWEIHDVLTGVFIKEEYSNILDTQKTDDYEKKHGPLSRADWIELKENGVLKVYVDVCEGWL